MDLAIKATVKTMYTPAVAENFLKPLGTYHQTITFLMYQALITKIILLFCTMSGVISNPCIYIIRGT